MRTLLPMLVCGCARGGIAVPSGPVGFEVAADGLDGLGGEVLALTVDDVALDAVGPSGVESVLVLVDTTFAPYESIDSVQWWLELGDHVDGELQVHLGAAGGPALTFEAGDKAGSARFSVDELVLSFPFARLTVEDAPTLGQLRLRPSEWLADLGVSLDHEDEDDDDDDYEEAPEPVVVDASSGSDYDRLLESIARTTELVWDR